MAKRFEERNPITKWEIMAKNPLIFEKNNKAVICGKIEEDFKFDHIQAGSNNKIFRSRVIVKKNKKKDCVPIMVSEKLLESVNMKGKWIKLAGVARIKLLQKESGFFKKELYILVNECMFFQEEIPGENILFLRGNLSKDGYSFDNKKVDIMLKVPRRNENEEDYIPCVVYGPAFDIAVKLKKETQVCFFCRFQSREYGKEISEGVFERRVAYELVTSLVRVLD